MSLAFAFHVFFTDTALHAPAPAIGAMTMNSPVVYTVGTGIQGYASLSYPLSPMSVAALMTSASECVTAQACCAMLINDCMEYREEVES